MIHLSHDSWQIQADIKGRSDFDFFITPNDKYCIYFSKIDEYGMMKFCSPVQIWSNKQNPHLLFQSKQLKFEYQFAESCYYLDRSDILILLGLYIHRTYFDLVYVLIDFTEGVFTTINAPDFQLTEVDTRVVRLDVHFRYSYDDETKKKISKNDGVRIDLNQLKWHPIKSIDKACSITSYDMH